MNPTAGSFVVDPRLQRLFVTLAVETPGVDSLMMIYGTFLHGHLKKFPTGGPTGVVAVPGGRFGGWRVVPVCRPAAGVDCWLQRAQFAAVCVICLCRAPALHGQPRSRLGPPRCPHP